MRITLILLLFFSAFTGLAEDIIITKNQKLRGKVKSADSKGVVIEIVGQGILTVPRSAIVQLKVDPPPSVIRGIEAYEKGNYKAAQRNLEKVINQYLGLDTPWAAKTLVYYGRGCLAAGDTANAEKAFSAFLSAYDDDQPLRIDAEIGLAETEVAKNDIDKALPKFQELAAEYEKQLKPPKEQFPYAAAVFLGLGKCLEAKNDSNGALRSYLKVIALYPADSIMPEALFRAALIYRQRNKLDQANLVLNDLITQYQASPYSKEAADLKQKIDHAVGVIEPLLAEQQSPAASEKSK
ncbi:MAG: tetratricopeptide repeat protein [Kiritimatiellia bacterium]|nr:tetratricopeptide repeat protein [Kiritimatiellia bacterium]